MTMTKRSYSARRFFAATALCVWPLLGAAQSTSEKDALVVSSFSLIGDSVTRDVRADALAVSEALFGLGYDVRRLENPDAAALSAAVSDRPSVIYYSGTEAELMPQINAALDAPALVFLDLCRAELVLDDEIVPAWDMPDTTPANTFIAASVAPGLPCGVDVTPVAKQLIEGLTVPGLSLDLAFDKAEEDAAEIWTISTLTAPVVLRQPSSDMRLTAEDYALLDSLSPEDQAKMVALWSASGIAIDRDGIGQSTVAPQRVVQDTIVISEPVRPIRTASPVISPLMSPGPARVQDNVSIIASSPVQTRAVQSNENRAVPGVGGLPTPSVIVGVIATEASFGTVTEDGGSLSGSEFDYSNLDARRAMRAENPDLFASLIETGAFDPPPSEVVIAIQTELTRMECYNRGIDGSWGSGSEAGLRRFYEQIDATPENLQPTLASFRQLLVQDDVVCPPVAVAAPAAPRATTAAAPRRNTAPAAPRATAPRAAAPAPAPAAPTRTINRSVGTGVFR